MDLLALPPLALHYLQRRRETVIRDELATNTDETQRIFTMVAGSCMGIAGLPSALQENDSTNGKLSSMLANLDDTRGKHG